MNPTPNVEGSRRPSELERVLSVLWRRGLLIVICMIVGGGVALGVSKLQTKEYSATASLLFRNPGFAEDLFGTTSQQETTDPTREAATNQKLVGLDVVGLRAAKHLDGLNPEEVSAMVHVSSEGEADVVSVTATSPEPAQAKEVANTFARQFIAFRAETDRSKLVEAKKLAEAELGRLSHGQQNGPRGQALSRGAEKLGILASLQTGNAELVQPAELPTSASSPKTARNTALGLILGLIVGIVLAFLLERLNRHLRDPEEARDAFDLPILAVVPESKAIMATNEGSAAPDLPFSENESFQMLRASLRYFNVDREIRSVVVTSSSAGVGKSTVSWNLARIAAHSSRVVIIETDLRKPTLARQHGLRSGPGLAALLTHQVSLDEAIQSKSLAALIDGDGDGSTSMNTLDVLVAGPPPPNPAELIESKTMRDVHSQLRERYDLIVFDTAPIGVVSDAFPLLREVDGVIVVVRLGHSTRDHAEHLREQLDRLDAPTLGVVANGMKARRGGRYGYGNDYYAEPESRQTEARAPVKH
ncbi:MAG TPA: polysaccharide biosynthesis tyrosine autokinase [Solirubrobacterales bacterium]|jgi:capsular exopolysaccharide synthesis family protein|nr:polysaccharide biosynthesis tyrosine autokinase [Solirubrobacterales bacterium]